VEERALSNTIYNVKTFYGGTSDELEEKINKFIESKNIMPVNISYSTSPETESYYPEYHAMILYRQCDEVN
jgi:hypothetical protein